MMTAKLVQADAPVHLYYSHYCTKQVRLDAQYCMQGHTGQMPIASPWLLVWSGQAFLLGGVLIWQQPQICPLTEQAAGRRL